MTPLFDDQIFYDPAPTRSYNVEEICNPNARSAENMHFGAILLNKICIKICRHAIISSFFVTPLFLMKNSVTPQLFHGPPIRKKMIAPLRHTVGLLSFFPREIEGSGIRCRVLYSHTAGHSRRIVVGPQFLPRM